MCVNKINLFSLLYCDDLYYHFQEKTGPFMVQKIVRSAKSYFAQLNYSSYDKEKVQEKSRSFKGLIKEQN